MNFPYRVVLVDFNSIGKIQMCPFYTKVGSDEEVLHPNLKIYDQKNKHTLYGTDPI